MMDHCMRICNHLFVSLIFIISISGPVFAIKAAGYSYTENEGFRPGIYEAVVDAKVYFDLDTNAFHKDLTIKKGTLLKVYSAGYPLADEKPSTQWFELSTGDECNGGILPWKELGWIGVLERDFKRVADLSAPIFKNGVVTNCGDITVNSPQISTVQTTHCPEEQKISLDLDAWKASLRKAKTVDEAEALVAQIGLYLERFDSDAWRNEDDESSSRPEMKFPIKVDDFRENLSGGSQPDRVIQVRYLLYGVDLKDGVDRDVTDMRLVRVLSPVGDNQWCKIEPAITEDIPGEKPQVFSFVNLLDSKRKAIQLTAGSAAYVGFTRGHQESVSYWIVDDFELKSVFLAVIDSFGYVSATGDQKLTKGKISLQGGFPKRIVYSRVTSRECTDNPSGIGPDGCNEYKRKWSRTYDYNGSTYTPIQSKEQKQRQPPISRDPLTWAGADNRSFKQFLAREFGVKVGDNDPIFPSALRSAHYPAFSSISLDWNDGIIAKVTIRFSKPLPVGEIRTMLGLPAKSRGISPNIHSVRFDPDVKKTGRSASVELRSRAYFEPSAISDYVPDEND